MIGAKFTFLRLTESQLSWSYKHTHILVYCVLPSDMDELFQPLQALSLNDVEVTGKEIGRGAYGVVLEVKVSGLSCAGKKMHDAIVEVICHLMIAIFTFFRNFLLSSLLMSV